MRREALSLNRQQAAAVSVLFGKPADREAAEQASPSDDGGKESNALHRDETDQRSGDGGDRPWRQPSPDEDLDADDVDLDADDVDLDADDAPSGNDPLAEFVEGGSES